MGTSDQIVDDFVRKINEQQRRFALTPGPLSLNVYRMVVEGMTISPRHSRIERNTDPGGPNHLCSLVDRYDVSKFSLTTFEFIEHFVDIGNGKIMVATMNSEDVLFDTWRRTIEVRPQTTDRTLLLASDQQHLLDLLVFIQHTQIVAAERMVYSGDIMDSDAWIAEAGRVGGGDGVSLYFSR